MAQSELNIVLRVNDSASGQLNKFKGNVSKATVSMKKDFTQLALKIGAAVIVLRQMTMVMKSFIDAASKVEGLQIRLKVLFGSVEEGNRLFKNMEELASRVPKTYDEIMESATNLAAVVRGGADEVTKLMPIIVDLSAATGISVRDTTSQMIRMYSAGAASADMFRERGVLAMLGFQAGVSYSAEETMKQVVAAFESADSKFRGASDELKDSWEGTMSMLSDAMFKFNQQLGEFITKSPKVLRGIEAIIYSLGFWAEYLDRINNSIDTQSGQLGFMRRRLEEVNAELDKEMQLLSTSWFSGERESRQQHINELLQEQSLLILTINRLSDERAEKERAAAAASEQAASQTKKNFEEISKAIDHELAQLAEVEKNIGKSIVKSVNQWGDAVGDAFAAMIFEGENFGKAMEAAFKQMAATFIAQVAAMIAKWLAFTALRAAGAFFGLFHEGGTVPSGRTIDVGIDSVYGGGNRIFHKGGAIRAHSGLAIDEVPIIAQTGEGILSRRGMSALGGSDNLNRINSGQGITSSGDINVSIYYPKMSTKAEVGDLVRALGTEIERQLRYARSI